jgi:predicted XRE-type DNA-binding protein
MKDKTTVEFTESSGNLFKDVGFPDAEAKKLQFRSFLITTLMKYIQSENISQVEAAQRLGVSQSRVSNLVHCRIDLFSTDMLLDMLERAGFKVYERMELDIAEAIDQPFLNFTPARAVQR